jgi:GNAT superfamily N-acetyltransferase
MGTSRRRVTDVTDGGLLRRKAPTLGSLWTWWLSTCQSLAPRRSGDDHPPCPGIDRDRLQPLVQGFAMSFRPERSTLDRSFDALIDRDDSLLIVAEIAGAVIAGYLLASHHGRLFANASVAWVEEVEEVTVAEPLRRSGIGRALMEEAERWTAGASGVHRPRHSPCRRVLAHSGL